ncbi:hypothetical protein CIL05_12730 [Virgibacillus profundi]|uniref:Uncharacterized protein n=1 Tax=Virgibacillus profundi TaxID=2024555 RepID=A0A2A2IDP3_9BACI|nr:hypothetical protein [Virgibacillus profundi]PAV29255.1 hypothetical protein CIL05_12730 [Virgibacillus profundi]PXY53424.1 hypothetical protein CIT14_12855 [Virgibacillus profundi]
MKNKFKELDLFTDQSSKIVKQLAKLKKAKRDAEFELDRVVKESEALIITEAVTGDAIDKVELNRLTKEKDKLQQEIKQLDLRISVTESKKPGLLKKHMEDLEKGYKREMDVLRKEVEKKLDGITPFVAEYLKYLYELGKLNREADHIHNRFLGAAGEVTDKYEKMYRFGYEWLDLDYELFGYEHTGSRKRGITKSDQLTAVKNGNLPGSIALYNLTGEVEPDQGNAAKKYNEATKNKK